MSGVLVLPVAAGDFEVGIAAAQRGDYKTAVSLWKPLAEQGDAIAQNNLGIMYAKGQTPGETPMPPIIEIERQS